MLDIELLTGDELITNEQLNNISAGIRDDDVPSSDDVVRNISLDIETIPLCFIRLYLPHKHSQSFTGPNILAQKRPSLSGLKVL